MASFKSLYFILILVCCLSFQESKHFFSDYTEVLHFRYPVSQEELFGNYYSKDPNRQNYPQVLFSVLPDQLDSKLAESLFHEGFIRADLKKKDFQTLDHIFSSRDAETSIVTDCYPVYRDILIFRKKKVVRGIVQLCFECSKAHFVGAAGQQGDFGQHEEFKQLKELLYGLSK